MNDRFRFRAWDKEEKILLQDIQAIWLGRPCYNIFLSKRERYIVEQCTGLKDKNGKLIYEGDIVKEGKIAWNDYTACFMIVFPDGDNREFGEIYTGYLEVIGNIHENLELLEGKNEK